MCNVRKTIVQWISLTAILCNAALLVLSWHLYQNIDKAYEASKVGADIEVASQMLDDWTKIPFVEMTVQDEPCGLGTESVWNARWEGTVEGCETGSGDIIPAHPRDDNEARWQSYDGSCTKIAAESAVDQHEFFGKYICGTKAGDNFLNVQRPVLQQDGARRCPEGTSACSKQDPENTVCYPEADHADKCPIIDLKFSPLTKTKETENLGYTVVPFNSEFIFAYSKTAGSAMNTGFQVGDQPCLMWTHHGQNVNAELYPLEHHSEHQCPVDPHSKKRVDGRYHNAGLTVTEYSVQSASGVWDTLQSLPRYNQEVTNAAEMKRDVHYTFWTRDVIDWKLTCEEMGNTRAWIWSAISNAVRGGPEYRLIRAFNCAFLAVTAVFIFASFIFWILNWRDGFDRLHKGVKDGMIFFMVLQALFIFVMWPYMDTLSNDNDHLWKSVNQLTEINACSDGWEHVDSQVVSAAWQRAKDMIAQILPLYFMVAGFFLFFVFLEITLRICLARASEYRSMIDENPDKDPTRPRPDWPSRHSHHHN